MARQRQSPFIANQGMRLLEAVREPKKCLSAAAFAAARQVGNRDAPLSRPGRAEIDPWEEIDRQQVADNTVPNHRLNRLVIVCDAGMGKSTTLEWLRSCYSAPQSDKLAILIVASELTVVAHEPTRFTQVLLNKLRQIKCLDSKSLPTQSAREFVERLRAAGRLVLLFDGIDQASKRAIAGLAAVLHDQHWQPCRIILASRPYALEIHWKELFGHADQAPSWRFVQLDEFSEEQQQAYLGKQRIACVPADGREILTIPRVLYYLRLLSRKKLERIRTVSQVYLYATRLLYDAALRARPAMGLDADQAEEFLAAIAFWMVRHGANFSRVTGQPLLKLKRWLTRRFFRSDTPTQRNECADLLKQVAAMNQFLHHGLLEGGCPRHIEWRNRSLQEFYAGLYLAKYARQEDMAPLWGWVPLANDEVTRKFYWVWRFAAEMPRSGRTRKSWVSSLATVYRPGDRTAAGTKRATEILYRSWTTMERYAKPARSAQAEEAIWLFLAEYPSMLEAGNEVAVTLEAGFLTIPVGEFTMGSPASEAWRFVDELSHRVRITRAFQLHRYPVTHLAYELFDPGHLAHRGIFSKTNEHPAEYMTWYDAWCFAKWAGCELPTEAQWEYGCRAGTKTPFHFGSISDGTQSNVDGRQPYGTSDGGPFRHDSSPVGNYRANSWGLYDMHGNVWEWCGDWYGEYAEVPVANQVGPETGEFRVRRGGSYSVLAGHSRAAKRGTYLPGTRGFGGGFRLARNR